MPIRLRFLPFAALLLVVTGMARIVATYPVFNQTSDEPYHVACGMQWLDQGKYDYEHQHPPLARIAVAVGPYLAGLRSTGRTPMVAEGNRILYSGGHYFRNLSLARMGVLPFFLMACALVWAWSRRLFGEAAALASVLLFTTLPPVLAHSGLATTDMAVSTFVFTSVYVFTLWLERPGWKESTLLGVSMALAVLSKFSALLFLPACLLVTLLLYWLATRPSLGALRKGALRRIGSLTLAAILALLVIWVGYRFSFGHIMPRQDRPSETVDKLVGTARLLAPELFDGIAEVEWHNAVGHSSWLLGEYRKFGWWYFFLVVLAVKTPLAFLLLCGIGYDACFAKTSWKHFAWQSWVPAASALTILAITMPSHINLGVRHILVIYPLLAIVAGLGAASLLQKGVRKRVAVMLGLALLVWQTLSSAVAHPDYLAYFNEFVWSEPERVLDDSDLDWGQDLQRLKIKLKEMGVQEVSLVYFGTADPFRLGLPVAAVLEPYQPATGWIAVSTHMLAIEAPAIQQVQGRTDSPLGWLGSQRPVAKVGKSIKLFYLPPRD